MQPFRSQVQHRKGNDSANADALSRQTEPDRQSKTEEGGRDVTEGQTAYDATEGQTSHGPD